MLKDPPRSLLLSPFPDPLVLGHNYDDGAILSVSSAPGREGQERAIYFGGTERDLACGAPGPGPRDAPSAAAVEAPVPDGSLSPLPVTRPIEPGDHTYPAACGFPCPSPPSRQRARNVREGIYYSGKT